MNIAPKINFNPRSPCGERLVPCRLVWDHWKISIHAPRAGSDDSVHVYSSVHNHFNPRSPCGERLGCRPDHKTRKYFNPRSPCGERQTGEENLYDKIQISIHAPRAGSDGLGRHAEVHGSISIHAPRAGSDGRPFFLAQCLLISIHAPRAGSDAKRLTAPAMAVLFQSTLPVRGATANTSIFLYEFPACLLSSPYKSDMSHFPRCFS